MDKILKAKVGLVLEQPFFATLLMRKQIIENPDIKTACVDGTTIQFNPQWVENLSVDEVKGVLAHEVMHVAMLHHVRRNGRDIGKWNQACDYAINGMLKDAKFILPENHLYNPAYDNMSAEDIYKMMPQDDNDDGDEDPGGCGGVNDAPKEQKSYDQQEAEAKQELAQALQIAKQQGSLPVGADVLFDVLQPKVSWKEVLARFVSEPAKNDYTFSRPNKRYMQQGFILPSLYSLDVGEIVLIVDSSGSMDKEALDRVFTEIHDVAGSFDAHMTVIYVDTEVQGVEEIEPTDSVDLSPKGGGGTDFVPGFEWLDQHGMIPKSVVYFTDGHCSSFPEEPSYPVLWAVTGGYKFSPPFGEVIKID